MQIACRNCGRLVAWNGRASREFAGMRYRPHMLRRAHCACIPAHEPDSVEFAAGGSGLGAGGWRRLSNFKLHNC